MARGFNTTYGSGTTDRLETTFTSHATARTYSCWVYFNSLTDVARIFDKRDGGVEAELLFYSTSDSTLRFLRKWDNTPYWKNTTAFSLDTWYHICVTYNSSSTANDATIYVNGSSTNSSEAIPPTGTLVNNSDKYVIGNRGDGSTADRCHDGILAEFAIWDRILTSGEITKLAGGVSPVNIATPVCYVPMTNSAGVADLYNTDPTATGTAVQDHPYGNVYINDAATWDSGAVTQEYPLAANWADGQIDMQTVVDITGLSGPKYVIVELPNGSIASRAITIASGAPVITDVNTTESWTDGDTGLVITGTDFV